MGNFFCKICGFETTAEYSSDWFSNFLFLSHLLSSPVITSKIHVIAIKLACVSLFFQISDTIYFTFRINFIDKSEIMLISLFRCIYYSRPVEDKPFNLNGISLTVDMFGITLLSGNRTTKLPVEIIWVVLVFHFNYVRFCYKTMSDFNHDMMPIYYKQLFPFGPYYRWLSYGNSKWEPMSSFPPGFSLLNFYWIYQ